MNEHRGPWYLITGVLIGIGLGLAYAWMLHPVEYTDTAPNTLRSEYKDEYRALISQAYAVTGDLVRARARLELLGDTDVHRALAEQAQRSLAQGDSADESRTLGILALALSAKSTASQPPGAVVLSGTVTVVKSQPGITITPASTALAVSPTSIITGAIKSTVTNTPRIPSSTTAQATSVVPTATLSARELTQSPSETPGTSRSETGTQTPATVLPRRPTGTPVPTLTPTRTPGALFTVEKTEKICDPRLGESLLQVQIMDASNQPVPGMEIIITWSGGEGHFYTGLKPEQGLGYADYVLEPSIVYTVRVAQGAQPVLDLTAPKCKEADGQEYWGAIRLTFIQP